MAALMNAVILSYGQDTNGGNQRFAEAARKIGNKPAVLKVLAIGRDDPAGVVGRYQAAQSKVEGLRIRSAHQVGHYFDWPTTPDSIAFNRRDRHSMETVHGWILDADIIHLNNSYRAVQAFGIRRKPLLLHHHGSMFRGNPTAMMEWARTHKAVQAVSTMDLTKPDPKVLHWLPTAYDVAALRRMKRSRDDGMVRIVHAPTNREAKHTDLLIRAVSELQAEGLPVELVMLERQTNAEVLAAKAEADIVFDQLAYGYGCNSVEAWAMEVPVISGADPWTLARMQKEWGGLPFYLADETTLKDAVRQMVTSADLRAEWAGKGYQHVLRYHDEQPALAKLAELYVEALHASGQKPVVDPVTFVNGGTVAIRVAGEVIRPGVTKVTDPDVIARLRYFVRSRPRFLIEEESA